jgi:hypothetical protein
MSRFSYPSHVCEDRLAEMPAEERVWRTAGIVEQATVEALPSQFFGLRKEKDNLVSVLKMCKLTPVRIKYISNNKAVTSGLIENI